MDNSLLESIDRAIAADEQRRGELLFELGKVNGRLEMARAIRAELAAADNVDAVTGMAEVADDDAG